MIFRRILELHARAADARTTAEGYAVSFVAHLLIVGGWFVGTRVDRMQAEILENFTPVQYLIPKEKLAGSRPQREQVSWVGLDTKGGSGYLPEPERPKDEERLEVVVPRGEEKQTEQGNPPLPPQPPIELGDSIKTELEVDSAVMRYEDSAAPPYPANLLRQRIEGSVIVQYVVDTTGHADTATFRIVAATHADFATSVKNTLPRMRFHPAVMNNHRVAQLVQQPFVFKIIDTTRVTLERPKRPPGR